MRERELRERDRERETERKRDRERDRQTDREEGGLAILPGLHVFTPGRIVLKVPTIGQPCVTNTCRPDSMVAKTT